MVSHAVAVAVDLANRSPSDALGEVEVQTTRAQPEKSTSLATGRPNPNPELFVHWRFCSAMS